MGADLDRKTVAEHHAAAIDHLLAFHAALKQVPENQRIGNLNAWWREIDKGMKDILRQHGRQRERAGLPVRINEGE